MFSLTGGGGGGGLDKNKNNSNSTLVKKDAATATGAATMTAATSTSTSAMLKWHLKLKECERGRKAAVDAKLLAIRDHLTALMHLTTAAHQETASTHRFLLGMALAQEQMAQAHIVQTTTSSTDDANNNKKTDNTQAKEAEQQQKQQQSSSSSSSEPSTLFPISSLEQSNQLMEQRLSACAADIRGNVLMLDNNNNNTTTTTSSNNDSTGEINNNSSSSSAIVNNINNTGTGAGGGLHHLLLTIQQQVRDLKRGQDYVEQLEELQRRIQKAWDAYLTRANISLRLGGDGGGGPAQNNAAGQSNSSLSASANAKNNANGGKKKNNKETPDNDNSKTKEDLWLAEWYYRNLVSKQAQAWDKASTRLTKLFQSIREMECQRRMNIRNHLVLFSQFQQTLFVGMEAASDIALLDYVGTEKKNNNNGDVATVFKDKNNEAATSANKTDSPNVQEANASPAATKTSSSPQPRRNSNESQPRRNSNESQPRRNSNESQTTITGFFGGIQQKLLGGMEATSEASALQQTIEEENIGPSAASTLATGAGETQAATAAVRKQVEDCLQTDIHRQLEEHPSLHQQKSDDHDQHGSLGDRDNILGFYQDLFPPESPLESDHVVMSTVVQKNKKFLQPGSTTNVMILEGLALVVITTENIIHLFDLRENASVDETATTLEGSNNNNTSRQHVITLQSSPTLAYRAILEQHQRDQLTPLSSSSSLSASSPQSIKSRMVEYAKSTTTSSSSLSAISASIHGGGGPVSEQVQESPEPCASLPLLECSLDTMRQENSIAIVHVKSSTRLELILPSAYEQVGMINTFARAAAAETAAEF